MDDFDNRLDCVEERLDALENGMISSGGKHHFFRDVFALLVIAPFLAFTVFKVHVSSDSKGLISISADTREASEIAGAGVLALAAVLKGRDLASLAVSLLQKK
jgi:hypothetical protein